MFWKKKVENPHPHVKYTKFGEPFLDVEEFYKRGLHKKLEKKREQLGEIVENTLVHSNKKSKN